MSKLHRAAQTLALTAATIGATASTASASASALAYAANVIFKEAVGFGVDAATSSALGSTNSTMDLSQDAFDAIEDIVEDVVATYQLSDYQTNVEDALDASRAYFRRDSTDDLLISSSDRAWDVYNYASSALNDMETTSYQGASSYMLMSALQLSFLIELAEVEDLLGEDGDHYRGLATSMGQEQYDYMRDLVVDWDDELDGLFVSRTKTIRSWYDGWYNKKSYEYCVDYGDEERCSDTRFVCKQPWTDTSTIGSWSCENNKRDRASAEVVALIEQAKLDATEEVFGHDYAIKALLDYAKHMDKMLMEAGADRISM